MLDPNLEALTYGLENFPSRGFVECNKHAWRTKTTAFFHDRSGNETHGKLPTCPRGSSINLNKVSPLFALFAKLVIAALFGRGLINFIFPSPPMPAVRCLSMVVHLLMIPDRFLFSLLRRTAVRLFELSRRDLKWSGI